MMRGMRRDSLIDFERPYLMGVSLAGAMVVGGIALWLFSMVWGIVLAVVGALVFVVTTWAGVKPEGGHAHSDLDPWAAG